MRHVVAAPLLALVLLVVLVIFVASCQSAGDGDASSPDDEWGMEGPLDPTPPRGKDDSEYRRGLLVATDTTRTQVWTARNKWEDRDTPAARAAGIAWPADSDLTWDEKYVRWIDSLGWVPRVDNAGAQTFELTTPFGKTLPSPSLECAETAIFLRITFAAWYELPFFLEAQDSSGRRVYFGHNGVRTSAGRYAQSPEFAIAYRDHSSTGPTPSPWPSDATLRNRKIHGGEDRQDMIAPNAVFGAYLDEIHLNKRAAYFTVMALNYLGSMHLADPANAYNITPESVRSGDVLIERWQRSGIGHTLVVKQVDDIGEGNKDVILVSGSMPRRQGVRESGVASKSYFTSNYTGGVGENSAGDPYVRLGGGIKRFRVTKNIGGYWTNTWMAGDEASWIDSTDYARLSARPARFQQMLGQVSPDQQRTELLAQIASSRSHLTQFPASCAARERREHAFSELYDLASRSFGQTRAEIDAAHRELADYVFAALDYGRSKTCCWNSTTAAMADIVMDLARRDADAADAAGTCAPPTVFKSQSSGYSRWAQHAATLGRAAEWRAWSEDEPCAQRDVAADTEADAIATPYCELDAATDPAACADAREPNESRATASPATGTIAALHVCDGDQDWFAIASAGTVQITFTNATGDLDLAAYDAAGNQIAISQSIDDRESVDVPASSTVRVYGYQGATGAYTLTAP